MPKRFNQEQIQAYLEHSLPLEQRSEIEAACADTALQRELSAYRAIHALEQHVSAEDPVLDEDLTAEILTRIYVSEARAAASVSMHRDEVPVQAIPSQTWRTMYYVVQSVNCVLLCCLLFLAQRQPQSVQRVAPEQYALVSLEVPVEAVFLRQGQRADVKVAYTADGQEQRRELLRFASIADVQSVEDSALARSRIYLQVPADRLREIQLALLLGHLELSPLPLRVQKAPPQQQLRDPLGRPFALSAAETPAVLYLDRHAGKGSERLAYREGAWVPEVPLHITAF